MKELGFFDGEFIDLTEKKVCIEDRGYQFGDGIYEVTHVYNGKCFALDRHLKRCIRSLRELSIPMTYMDEELIAIHKDIIHKSQVKDGIVYFQITRGTSPRTHSFPDKIIPHLSMTIRPSAIHTDWQENGIHAIWTEDLRWLRCDIKTINLLGNVLAKQKAHIKSCQEAIQFRQDTNFVTEGSSSNFFIVKDGIIWTHPSDNLILKGVTRSILLDECVPKLSLAVVEKAFTPQFALTADEAFITSTSFEITPVVSISGNTISDGNPGKVTRKLLSAYHGLIKETCYKK
ncbi:MAG: D-amino-acid transaminase [Selenomonadaceae bacterium]